MQKFLWFVVLCGVGSVVVMVPLALGGLEALVHFGITYRSRIVEGGMGWSSWLKPPVPVYLRVRIFNITNPKDFQKGEKPIVQEAGPYVYREVIEKVDITRDDLADTIKYRQVKIYYFEPKLSRGKETDYINIINIGFVSIAKMAHDVKELESQLESLDKALRERGEKLTQELIVKEILFDGMPTKPFLQVAKDPNFQSAIPNQLMNRKFGIFEGRNGSDEGWIEVLSGSRNSADFGRATTWNEKSNLDKWKGEPCNVVRGTDASRFQPFLTLETKLDTFVPEFCRSQSLLYEKSVDHDSILTFRYIEPKSVYESAKKNPENQCFCHNDDVTLCPPNGVIDVAKCYEGLPLVMSLPHFLFGNKKALHMQGLSPDADKHFGYFDLHPMTGIPVEARQRIQYAIELQPWPEMPTFQNVPKLFFPILWTEEARDLEESGKTWLLVLDFGLKLWGFGKWVAIVFWMLVTGGAIALIMYNRKNARVELIDEKDDDYADE